MTATYLGMKPAKECTGVSNVTALVMQMPFMPIRLPIAPFPHPARAALIAQRVVVRQGHLLATFFSSLRRHKSGVRHDGGGGVGMELARDCDHLPFLTKVTKST
jgi:hypothetical protein